jgi:LysR family transcriptional regulator, glycine cleavage system transcriptional activator
MPRRLPPLNALRAFEAAARHDSFTGAASELRVSHAAISRHVRALEARLGVTLFRKAARGVQLTEEGRRYLQAVSDAFDSIAAATETLARTSQVEIRVSVEPSFAAKWLIARLGRFREAHPDYDVVLEASPRLVDLERDEADLAIRYGRGGWPGVREELIAPSQLYPVGSPRLIGRRKPRQPEEIAQFTLLHEDGGGLWRRWFEAAGAPDIDVTRGPRFLEAALAIDAAVAGQGVALAEAALIAGELAARRLIKLSEVGLVDGAFYLLSLEAVARRRPIAAFRAWLLAEAESLHAA